MLSGKYVISDMKIKGYRPIEAKNANGLVWQSNPFFIEYSLNVYHNPEDASTKLYDTDSEGNYLCIPRFKTLSNDEWSTNFTRILVFLLDGTTIDNLNCKVSEVRKIRLYYPEDTYTLRFTGSPNRYSQTDTYNRVGKIHKFGCRNFTTFEHMFDYTRLNQLNTSLWETQNVTNMSYMFNKNIVYGGANIKLTNLVKNKCTDISYMINSCPTYIGRDIYGFESWDTSGVTNMRGVFNKCEFITDLNDAIVNWDTSNVTDMGFMFYNCQSLDSLDLSNWNVGNVVFTDSMFDGCTGLSNLNLSTWDTHAVTYSRNMLSQTEIEEWSYDGSNYKTFHLTEGDTGYSGMFPWTEERIVAQYTIPQSINGDTFAPVFNDDFEYKLSFKANSNGTCTVYCYSDDNFTTFKCNKETISIERLKITKNVTSMDSMFADCKDLVSVDTNGWDTCNVISMWSAFKGCNKLKTIDPSNWDTRNVLTMSYLFSGCSSLVSLDLSSWNLGSSKSTISMFSNCTSLRTLDLSAWDTSNLESVTDMLVGVNSNINWRYDGSNYENFKLTEQRTGFAGRFPWNK